MRLSRIPKRSPWTTTNRNLTDSLSRLLVFLTAKPVVVMEIAEKDFDVLPVLDEHDALSGQAATQGAPISDGPLLDGGAGQPVGGED
jgi:hypothetical protein